MARALLPQSHLLTAPFLRPPPGSPPTRPAASSPPSLSLRHRLRRRNGGALRIRFLPLLPSIAGALEPVPSSTTAGGGSGPLEPTMPTALLRRATADGECFFSLGGGEDTRPPPAPPTPPAHDGEALKIGLHGGDGGYSLNYCRRRGRCSRSTAASMSRTRSWTSPFSRNYCRRASSLAAARPAPSVMLSPSSAPRARSPLGHCFYVTSRRSLALSICESSWLWA